MSPSFFSWREQVGPTQSSFPGHPTIPSHDIADPQKPTILFTPLQPQQPLQHLKASLGSSAGLGQAWSHPSQRSVAAKCHKTPKSHSASEEAALGQHQPSCCGCSLVSGGGRRVRAVPGASPQVGAQSGAPAHLGE